MAISNYDGQYTGSGQTIVIIDSGASVTFSNENIIYQWDFADDDDNTYSHGTLPGWPLPIGGHHHGGQVAMVAQTIAPDINIIHLKVQKDSESTIDNLVIREALDWVLDNNDVYDITAVNISIGGGNTDRYPAPGVHLFDAQYTALDNLDIVTTVAAGNGAGNGNPNVEPYEYDGINGIAAHESVIAVSAVDSNNEFAPLFQRHEHLTDISALGLRVPLGGSLLAGTSLAAPNVAGAAALIQEIAQDLLGHRISDEQFLDIIQRTADDINPSTYTINNDPDTHTSSAQSGYNQFHSHLMTDSQSITPGSDPGGTIATAYNINPTSNTVVINQSVGHSFDAADYYSFSLNKSAVVSIDLTNLEGDVDLILMNSHGHAIQNIWKVGYLDLNITETLTAEETYYIVTSSFDRKLTDYTLSIDFNGGISNEDTPDRDQQIITTSIDSGDQITSAYEIGSSSNEVQITETLGGSDETDYFSFTLDNSAVVDISLTGLEADVDLYLKNSAGETIVHEWAWGSVDLELSHLLDADETYYIVTQSWDEADTQYTLDINFNDGIDTPEPLPAGYAGINIENAVNYFEENHQDYAVV